MRRKVDAALKQVSKVLDTSRNPQHPADVPHSYADKFQVVELCSQATVASLMGLLSLGDHQATMLEWVAAGKAVSLRYEQTNKCHFDRTTERKVESDVQHVTESTMFGKTTSKTITKVTEHFWNINISWELSVYAGSDPKKAGSCVTVYSGRGQSQMKTNGPEPVSPRKDITQDHVETRVDWLLKCTKTPFVIKRDVKTCKTPRHNDEVYEAIKFCCNYRNFASSMVEKIRGVFGEQTGHTYDLKVLSREIFQPVLAAFCFDEVDGQQGPTMTKDIGTFLAEEQRSWTEHCEQIGKLLPAADSGELITAPLARWSAAFHHTRMTVMNLMAAVDAVEGMLYDQLRAAVGKELTAADFGEYMDFHNRRLYKPDYRPKGFCYAIRRPDHYPEGTMAIEARSGKDGTPIQVFTVQGKATTPMKFPLSAAADLSFYGDRYLHACVLHQFGGSKPQGGSLYLNARARQFSSFILLVGKIGSADTFDPTAALIVQNKDDLTIPLVLETIPTAKEFRDAIESLSPEQQNFAKAFRAMQLASTVFGVMVIQIKPQMERLLKLPEDSLTKEVQLTQELMELFIKYQLSSDLLSYDGPEDASAAAKITRVREHAKVLRDMIDAERSKELAEEMQKAEMAKAERMYERSYERASLSYQSRSLETLEMAAPVAMACAAPCAAPMPMMAMARNAPPPPPMMSKTAPPPPAPAPAPAPQQQQPQQPQQSERATLEVRGGVGGAGVSGSVDYTAIPNVLESRFDQLSQGSSVRPTIIKPGTVWKKKYQDGLIASPKEMNLYDDEQRTQRNKAFDLLDALSRSGSLPVDSAELHVVLAATHCFEKMLLDTVVQDNVNPIEKAERSGLIMSTTISGKPPTELIEESHVPRLQGHSEGLFLTQ